MPDDMLDATRLETKSTLCLIWHIVLPHLRGGMICLFVLEFTELWNMVAEPLVLQETEWKMPLAAVVVFLLMPLLLYLLYADVLWEKMGNLTEKTGKKPVVTKQACKSRLSIIVVSNVNC